MSVPAVSALTGKRSMDTVLWQEIDPALAEPSRFDGEGGKSRLSRVRSTVFLDNLQEKPVVATRLRIYSVRPVWNHIYSISFDLGNRTVWGPWLTDRQRESIYRALERAGKNGGLSEWTADRVACKLRLNPYELWGEQWWED